MSRYYEIRVDGNTVYACTDPHRFAREAQRVAAVQNATLVMPTPEDR